MRSAALSVAYACNLAGTFLVMGFGLLYLVRREFMPYHAVALGRSWAQIDPPIRVLVLAMLRGIGGLGLGVAFLQLAILFFPFRDGAVWALWAMPISGIIVSTAALYGMSIVRRHTPAKPPRLLGLVGCALFVTALCLSLWALYGPAATEA